MPQGRTKAKWETSKFKQVFVKINRKITAFLQNLEEMHKKSDFQWTREAEAAFKQIKKLIAELPMLTLPKEKEELIIYLAAAKEAISAVLMTEREGKQIPVPRASIKGQILEDFIVERPEEESPDVPITEPEEIPEPWTLFTDGSSCIDGSGAGLILTNPEGVEFTYAMRFRFEATNNEAEYEALIAGLRIARQMVHGSVLGKGKRAHKQLQGIFHQASTAERKQKGRRPKQDCIYKLHTSNMHSGPRSIVAKAIRTGYYWPTMHADARKLIRECNDCQIHRPVPRNPQQNLTPITSPWPFYKWGIDIAGPFLKSMGQRFGLPGEIVSDNGKQFCENPSKDGVRKQGIRQCFALRETPINQMVWWKERNMSLEKDQGVVDERSKDWMGELSHVLWAHRTMIKSSNGETPFSLTYVQEAVIPSDTDIQEKEQKESQIQQSQAREGEDQVKSKSKVIR
ncbi:reverse transcriptase domain-containing protein [Tanacetum coccineum]